jgi:hypothetical protein
MATSSCYVDGGAVWSDTGNQLVRVALQPDGFMALTAGASLYRFPFLSPPPQPQDGDAGRQRRLGAVHPTRRHDQAPGPVWWSGTSGAGTAALAQDDGNSVIYSPWRAV